MHAKFIVASVSRKPGNNDKAVLARRHSAHVCSLTYLWQRGEALLLHVPHQLISWELEALLHVQVRHVNSHQQVALLWGRCRVLLHLQRDGDGQFGQTDLI